jgi:hypothetical protein
MHSSMQNPDTNVLVAFYNGRASLTHTSTQGPQVLGIREKTLHPRNVGFAEVHEISFRVMCENSSHI